MRTPKNTQPAYAAEDAATGLYLNLDGEEPRHRARPAGTRHRRRLPAFGVPARGALVTLLQLINGHLHPGSDCPKPGVIGDCAAIFPREGLPNQYEAHLHIWDRSFNDSTLVAQWFRDGGARDIWVQHTLYSDATEDRGGWDTVRNSRHWIVTFVHNNIEAVPRTYDDAKLLARAKEIVQWSVDVKPRVTVQELNETRAIKAALDLAIQALHEQAAG